MSFTWTVKLLGLPPDLDALFSTGGPLPLTEDRLYERRTNTYRGTGEATLRLRWGSGPGTDPDGIHLGAYDMGTETDSREHAFNEARNALKELNESGNKNHVTAVIRGASDEPAYWDPREHYFTSTRNLDDSLRNLP